MDDQPQPLPPGAPASTLSRSRYAWISSNDFRGRCVVLEFYPGDWEPVSREQLTLYGEHTPTLHGLRTTLTGIATVEFCSHEAFARDAGLRFPLLEGSHPEGAVARGYGTYLKHEGLSCWVLFVVDGGLIRCSQACPTSVDPGVDGISRALRRLTAPPPYADVDLDRRRIEK